MYSELFADVVRSVRPEFAELPAVTEPRHDTVDQEVDDRVDEEVAQRVRAAFGWSSGGDQVRVALPG